MSKRQYIEALNKEIQKLNGVIDWKIMHASDYSREARRHRTLLSQLRREEARRSFFRVLRIFFPLWR